MSDVESLRDQLRQRGYLTNRIERWFALDPWSSRTFWAELITVAAKAATLIALFGSLPCTAVMLVRNRPLGAAETLELLVLYAAAWFAIVFALVLAVALLMKIRPELPVETSRGLLAVSIATSTLLVVPLAFWWYEFDTIPTAVELVIGGALAAILFVVAAIVISAALLSFTIYELQRIPAIHQKPRGAPLTVAAAVLIALLFAPAYATPERREEPPLQVVIAPTTNNVALIAVDGLTFELARARPDLLGSFPVIAPLPRMAGASATERWASVGTGVPPSLHRVRAVDGVQLASGAHMLQSVSRGDVVLRDVAPALRIARRQPLPPTVRRRDYVWEIFAGRGLSSVAVNWWTSDDVRSPTLDSVSQTPIFSAAAANARPEDAALRVDETASARAISDSSRLKPRFATVYLPALDIVQNRIDIDAATRLAASVRALENMHRTIEKMRSVGSVIVIGLPGDGQTGHAVLASQLPLSQMPSSAFDLAPTVCALLGFPPSEEMPGRPLIGTAQRIATYGARNAAPAETKVNKEYYETLRSLGYIR